MCAIPGTGGVLRIAQSAEISTYTTGKRLVFPNFAAFDSEGNRYLTDSGDCDKANGRLLLVRPTGEVEVLVGSYLHYPNGLAIDPSGSWLYLAQTTASNILRFPIKGNGLGDPEIYATIPGLHPTALPWPRAATSTWAATPPTRSMLSNRMAVSNRWWSIHGRICSTVPPIWPSATECCDRTPVIGPPVMKVGLVGPG